MTALRRTRRRPSDRIVVLRAIRQIPSFVRLLIGLLRDRRVSLVDKLLVGGALAYLALPVDMVPDLVPFLGMVDDVFLLSLTIKRLIRNAGFGTAARHWDGDRADLRKLRIDEILAAAALLLPRGVVRRLKRRVD